ncbi:MAG: hypothetical protein M1825_005922 [Sarcosagium campestre]|nr:MAG: hypothetical protein M1825_005922 [Sarcosagium campestre]
MRHFALFSVLLSAGSSAMAQNLTESPDYRPTDARNLSAVLATTPILQELNSYVIKDPCVFEQYNTATNVTVFAAISKAWEDFKQSPLGPTLENSTLVHAALQYVVVNGIYTSENFSSTPLFPKTHLFDPGFSQVTGGQVVKLQTSDDGLPTAFHGVGSNSTIIRPDVFFDGGVVHIVNNLFVFPQDIVATAGALSAVLGSVNALVGGLKPGQASPASLSDVTIFAPAQAYSDRVKDAIKSNGDSAASSLLDAHTVSGKVVYSTDLEDGATIDAKDGSHLKFTTNSTGAYVNGIAILQADLLVSNGVVHIIDGVL